VKDIPAYFINRYDMSWYKQATIRDELRLRYPQVKIWITEENDKIIFSYLYVPEELRGQGIGKKIMKEVIAYANSAKKPIYLTPETLSGKNRLISWYERFGFKDKSEDDFSTQHTMKKEPE
jgi:GNAT superfamily N-acetyltransferase